ncbi:MAG TPA: hypothetical protein ENO23_02075 [Alphaproteobacteria bacterium]|nr:hypothetical protein [Alphaproteobacteria bacterium]
MRRNALLGTCLALVLTAAGCQDQLTEPAGPATAVTGTAAASVAGLPAVDLVAPAPAGPLADALPAGWARDVINGNVYQCTASTPVLSFLIGIINQSIAVELPLLLQLNSLAAFDVPALEAFLIQPWPGPQEYGYDGDFTNVIRRTDASSRRFWDIDSDDIEVVPLKGSMLLDVDRVATVYEQVFALDPISAALFAGVVRDLVLASQTLDGGNHPLFSANAFAAGFSGRIAMGDAILEGYAEFGMGDVATAGIFAHEYAHHVQFQKGYFSEDPPSFDPGNIDQAERTRYTELMADAMAAYFLTHKLGAAMNWWRVEQFLDVFFNVGDCAFSNSGHHGTPEQRMRTARWAYELARDALPQGDVLTADEFHDLFVAEYLTLIAPDLGQPAPDGNVDPGDQGRARRPVS